MVFPLFELFPSQFLDFWILFQEEGLLWLHVSSQFLRGGKNKGEGLIPLLASGLVSEQYSLYRDSTSSTTPATIPSNPKVPTQDWDPHQFLNSPRGLGQGSNNGRCSCRGPAPRLLHSLLTQMKELSHWPLKLSLAFVSWGIWDLQLLLVLSWGLLQSCPCHCATYSVVHSAQHDRPSLCTCRLIWAGNLFQSEILWHVLL